MKQMRDEGNYRSLQISTEQLKGSGNFTTIMTGESDYALDQLKPQIQLGGPGSHIRANTSLADMRPLPLYTQKACNRRSQPRLDNNGTMNLRGSSEAPIHPNTLYYLQHGSEVLNKSLKGQVVSASRCQSSTMASKKQRAMLEARGHQRSKANNHLAFNSTVPLK